MISPLMYWRGFAASLDFLDEPGQINMPNKVAV
jgi:hypothetical protein